MGSEAAPCKWEAPSTDQGTEQISGVGRGPGILPRVTCSQRQEHWPRWFPSTQVLASVHSNRNSNSYTGQIRDDSCLLWKDS